MPVTPVPGFAALAAPGFMVPGLVLGKVTPVEERPEGFVPAVFTTGLERPAALPAGDFPVEVTVPDEGGRAGTAEGLGGVGCLLFMVQQFTAVQHQHSAGILFQGKHTGDEALAVL